MVLFAVDRISPQHLVRSEKRGRCKVHNGLTLDHMPIPHKRSRPHLAPRRHVRPAVAG
jgi:hypothetical protein